MLDFQIVQAPMRLGLAEGIEPHQTTFGTLTTAMNACWSKTGLLEKRLGTQALAKSIVGGGSLALAARLIVRDKELALTDGTTLYSYTASGWVSRGLVPNVGLQWATAHVAQSTSRTSDVAATGNGQVVEAWIQGDLTSSSSIANNALMYQVRDLATGVLVTPPTKLLGYANIQPQIRVLSYGSASWFVLFATGFGEVWCLSYSGALTRLATTGVTTGLQALDAIVLGSNIIVAWSAQAGGIGIARASAVAAPVVAATGTTAGTDTNIQSISIAGGVGETLYVTWAVIQAAVNGIRFAAADPSTLAQTVAPLVIETVGSGNLAVGTVACARLTSTTCLLVYSYSAGVTYLTGIMRRRTITNAGVVTSSAPDVYGVTLLSKPAILGGRYYVAIASTTTEIGSGLVGVTSDTLLVDVTPGSASNVLRQVGKLDALTGSYWSSGYTSSAPIDANALTAYMHVPFRSDSIAGASGIVDIVGARRVTLTIGDAVPADMWRSVSIAGEAYFAAGMLGVYDGAEAIGYGWPFGPLIDPWNTNASAAGGVMLAGNYLYNVTAERRSAAGILHRSPVGTDYKVTTTGNTSSVTVALIAPSVGHATQATGVFVFYRSVVNGSITQRIGMPPKTMTLLDDGSLSFPATVVDTQSDSAVGPSNIATLQSRPALYTIGGELEDMQPPSALTLAYHQNRIWMVAGDGTTVWLSKDRTTNPGVAPGFHPSLTFVFDRQLTALVPMDEKLIVFAANTFWVMLGQGPGPNGQNGSYEIAPVQTDVGCINPRSVVSTPDGIMFLSERGIYLLSRALELSWIGRPVKDEVAVYNQITSAVLVAKRNEIRFTAFGTPLDTTISIVLVYNYVERQWTTSRYTAGGFYGRIIVDACIWQGRWTALANDGTVFYEVDDFYGVAPSCLDTAADATTAWAPTTIETAWINATGPLSFQSVRNFSCEGVARSAHSLTIEAGFDSDPSYPQTKTFVVAATGPQSFDISIGTQRKCHAIRFRLTDAAPAVLGANTGQGSSLAMLGIEVGQKKGFAKKPVARTG